MEQNNDIAEANDWLNKNSGNYTERSLDAAGIFVASQTPDAPSETKASSADSSSSHHNAELDASRMSGDKADSPPSAESPQYTKAMEALQRGLPKAIRDKTISTMSREEILEVGMQMAEDQAERDRLGSEIGRLKEAKDSDGKGSEDSGEDTDAPAPSDSSQNGEMDLSAVLAPFDLEFESEDLPAALAAVAKHVDSLAQSRIGELEGIVAELRGESVSRQLEGRFPQLRDPQRLREVLEKAQQYERVGDFEYTPGANAAQKFRERVELAAEVLIGQRASYNKVPLVEQGQPPAPSRASVSSAKGYSSELDKANAFIETWQATGGDRAAAQRAYQR